MMLISELQQPSAADDRATDFKAVEGDTGEHFSGYTLMVEAYAAIWIVLMGWLLLIWRKQLDLAKRVDGLESAIARAEKKTTAAKAAPPKSAA
jgi:CcmD family protein